MTLVCPCVAVIGLEFLWLYLSVCISAFIGICVSLMYLLFICFLHVPKMRAFLEPLRLGVFREKGLDKARMAPVNTSERRRWGNLSRLFRFNAIALLVQHFVNLRFVVSENTDWINKQTDRQEDISHKPCTYWPFYPGRFFCSRFPLIIQVLQRAVHDARKRFKMIVWNRWTQSSGLQFA